MESTTDETLSRVFELTEAMEAAAAQGDWLHAAALAQERSPLLMSLPPTQTPHALSVIRAIQDIDSAVTRHADAGRDELATRLNDSMQRIKAAGSYQTVGKLWSSDSRLASKE